MRPIEFLPAYLNHPDGSCLVKFGGTHVLCSAFLEERTASFLRGSGSGWITAEYALLPGSTRPRVDRETHRGRPSGRSQEIQRLIGRALRSSVDLKKIGERQVRIDCDVIEADGGTRVASICGAYVAMAQCFKQAIFRGILTDYPIKDSVTAISCGVVMGHVLLDLDYAEDSIAEVDANFVFSGTGTLVEIQVTGEKTTFSQKTLIDMVSLAESATTSIKALQEAAIATTIK
jgi:ribonuclease PH